MTITISKFEHVFDDEPAEVFEFETVEAAQEWLNDQPGTIAFSIASDL